MLPSYKGFKRMDRKSLKNEVEEIMRLIKNSRTVFNNVMTYVGEGDRKTIKSLSRKIANNLHQLDGIKTKLGAEIIRDSVLK